MLGLCLRAAGAGAIGAMLSLAVAVPLWPIVGNAAVPFLIITAIGLVNVLVPINFFTRISKQIPSSDRAFAAGAAYGFAASAPFVAFGALLEMSINSGPTITTSGLLECAWWCISYQVIAAIAGGAVVAICFAVARSTSVKSTKGASTTCPRCEYCLIGNTSMQCPECGRAFTFEEMGTTEEEFRELTKEVDS